MLRRRLIGLAVLAGAIGLAWLGIVKPDPFHHDEVVHVIFDHVQGIALVQRDVRVAGVNVGTIGSVRRVGVHAEVDLLLHGHIPVYRDARAELRPHTPFEGTTFVDLDPGTAGAGPLGGAAIPLRQTNVFVSAGDVLSVFSAPVRRSFQVIVAQLSRALQPRAQEGLSTAIHNAPALLRDTAAVAPAWRGPSDARGLRTLIPSLSSTVDALAGSDGQLRRAVHGARATLDAITVDDAAPLDRSLALLPGALSRTRTASADLVAVLHRAGAAATALVPTLRAIPATAGPLVHVFKRADPTLPAVPAVVSEFAATLRNLGRSAPALARLLGVLGPTARLLRYSLVPSLDRRSALGLPTYLQLIAAVTGLTGALSSFVTPTQVGNGLATGHELRATLQAPVTLPLGALSVPCSAIGALNPGAVSLVQQLGLCTP